MFTKQQEILLNNFADKSDKLFELGVISTDSFTGEIGEYIICKHFNLKKSKRVTKAVDGVSSKGERFQVKSKIVSKNNFSYSIKELEQNLFDTLAIVYFDIQYNPLKVLIIPSSNIINGEITISASTISRYKQIDSLEIKTPIDIKNAINEFAKAYNSLEENQIIRSRRIVGDIGEFYACRKLNLNLSENRNEKGIDARHTNGLTFEIKTRRVYESGRRVSETRRLNNLVGKTADYLIVVTLDRSFKCSGMWIIPMNNVINPKSANLKIVNTTKGTRNLIPSEISWLKTGENFNGFEAKKKTITPSTKIKKSMTKPKQIKATNPFKIVLYILALVLWLVTFAQLSIINTTDFSWTSFLFTLIFGIIITRKANKMKPIISTIDNSSNSTLNDNENYFINTQFDNKSNKNIRRSNTSNTNRNINEDDIYGMAYDMAGEGIEDEVRDFIDCDRKDYNHHFDNDEFDEYDKH